MPVLSTQEGSDKASLPWGEMGWLSTAVSGELTL